MNPNKIIGYYNLDPNPNPTPNRDNPNCNNLSPIIIYPLDLLADVIDFRGFFKINVMKSVGKQIEIIKKCNDLK